jgi:hypothetical protein
MQEQHTGLTTGDAQTWTSDLISTTENQNYIYAMCKIEGALTTLTTEPVSGLMIWMAQARLVRAFPRLAC